MFRLTRNLKYLQAAAFALGLITASGVQAATCTEPPPAAAPAYTYSGAPASDGYQLMYHQMWQFIGDNYFDPARLKNWQSLEHAFDDKLGTMDDIQNALKELGAATGDKWTVYITQQDMREYADIARQNLVIGGLMLYKHGAHYRLDVIHYGSAAYGTALRERDDVVCLNHVAIDTLNQKQVDQLLRGAVGDKLIVTAIAQDTGVEYEVELTLKAIPDNVVEARLLPGNIVYIRMPSFDGENYINAFIREFNQVYAEAQAAGGARGMVLDLRNNLGGELPAAQKFSSLFLTDGQVVTKSIVRNKPVKDMMVIKADEIEAKHVKVDPAVVKILRELPMTVLSNGSSASAAEITLGALKDNKRGLVVGVRSFGKGVGYKVQPGPVGGFMSLTGFKYVTPSGAEVHEHGIDPDVVVLAPRNQSGDQQLDEAIRLLNQGIAIKP